MTPLEQIAERLTCLNGAPHYCPNCDNSIGPNILSALQSLAQQGERQEMARQPLDPDPKCPRCKGTGEEPNAQFRCACRWRDRPVVACPEHGAFHQIVACPACHQQVKQEREQVTRERDALQTAMFDADERDALIHRAETAESSLASAKAEALREAAEIAEGYLHTLPTLPNEMDALDRQAAYSNGTVQRIVAQLRQRADQETQG